MNNENEILKMIFLSYESSHPIRRISSFPKIWIVSGDDDLDAWVLLKLWMYKHKLSLDNKLTIDLCAIDDLPKYISKTLVHHINMRDVFTGTIPWLHIKNLLHIKQVDHISHLLQICKKHNVLAFIYITSNMVKQGQYNMYKLPYSIQNISNNSKNYVASQVVWSQAMLSKLNVQVSVDALTYLYGHTNFTKLMFMKFLVNITNVIHYNPKYIEAVTPTQILLAQTQCLSVNNSVDNIGYDFTSGDIHKVMMDLLCHINDKEKIIKIIQYTLHNIAKWYLKATPETKNKSIHNYLYVKHLLLHVRYHILSTTHYVPLVASFFVQKLCDNFTQQAHTKASRDSSL